MKYDDLKEILSNVKGCTFASIDAETSPCRGLRRVVTGEKVILFTNKKGSGYENKVKKALAELGKDPDAFTVSDLPFGMRIEGTPFITHLGKYYLQTVLLSPGDAKYYLGQKELTSDQAKGFLPKKSSNQGLGDNPVVVHTYLCENITGIRAMGSEFYSEKEPPRHTSRANPEAQFAKAAPKQEVLPPLPRRNAPTPNSQAELARRLPMVIEKPKDSNETKPLLMAALIERKPNDDDAEILVYAAAEYRNHRWERCSDIHVSAGNNVIEETGFKVVGVKEFIALVPPRHPTLRIVSGQKL